VKNPILKRDRLCHDIWTSLYNRGFVHRYVSFETSRSARAVGVELAAATSKIPMIISMGSGGKGRMLMMFQFTWKSQLTWQCGRVINKVIRR
jgi:hypothetical protein